jgi:hypothetical protein
MEQNRTGAKDIMVFSFAKNSQFNSVDEVNHEYDYVFRILSRMLAAHEVDVPKIGIGGYVEDVASFISFIIKTYHFNTSLNNIDISDFDPDEFDPDIEPIILPGDQDSDHQ